MESLGSAVCLLLLILGIIIICFKKDSRILGILAIMVATFFLYYIPFSNLNAYQNKSVGTYINDAGHNLIVHKTSTVAIYDANSHKIDSGNIEYENIDGCTMTLYGAERWLHGNSNFEIESRESSFTKIK